LRKKVRRTCVSEGDFSFVSLSFVADWTKESEKHLQGVFRLRGVFSIMKQRRAGFLSVRFLLHDQKKANKWRDMLMLPIVFGMK